MDENKWSLAGSSNQWDDETATHPDPGGHTICLARSGPHVSAVEDEFSHGQVRLSEGDLEDGLVERWIHASRFDLPTGPPDLTPVPVCPVRVVGGVKEVQLPSLGTAEVAHG
ncbi:MAG: Rieske (2Fe-2S) protein [Actinomycetota bacterium]|nr:Rieske (2Fe-2S) protein [Actinomycetota bacterium]